MKTNNVETKNEQFDQALVQAFEDAPACGALGTFDDLTRRRMINDILVAAAATETTPNKVSPPANSRLRTVIIGLAAGFIVVCATAAFFAIQSLVPQPANSETYFGEVKQIEGRLLIDNKAVAIQAPIPVGKPIHTSGGAALLHLPTSIDWWMDKNTGAQIESLSPDHIRIAVQSGENWFRVHPKRKGPAFSITTKVGRIDVTGTVFIVTAQKSKVQLTLLKGQVLVTPTSGRQYFVNKGNTIQLSDGVHQSISPDEIDRLNAHLRDLEWETTPETHSATPEVSPSEVVDQPVSKSRDQAPSKPTTVTARALLKDIQKHRKKRNWSKVETLYKRVMQIAPGSETAIVSRVSLGEVYLTQLHRYNDALSFFNEYLRSGHTALLPEASYGRCEALKRLGRKKQERQCLDKFILHFSTAFQVSEAKTRLEALRSQVQ